MSYAKIRRELGWEPHVGLADGLRRRLAFYRAYRDQYWNSEDVARQQIGGLQVDANGSQLSLEQRQPLPVARPEAEVAT